MTGNILHYFYSLFHINGEIVSLKQKKPSFEGFGALAKLPNNWI